MKHILIISLVIAGCSASADPLPQPVPKQTSKVEPAPLVEPGPSPEEQKATARKEAVEILEYGVTVLLEKQNTEEEDPQKKTDQLGRAVKYLCESYDAKSKPLSDHPHPLGA